MSPSDSCRAVGNLDDSQNNSLIFLQFAAGMDGFDVQAG